MEMTKRLFSLLLVFSLLVQTGGAYAVVDPETGEEVPTEPQNPPGTPPGVTCSVYNQTPGTNGVCCVGLELNQAGKCDEPSFADTSSTSCTSNSDCAPGVGCFPQTTTTMYSNLYPGTDPDVQSDKKQDLEGQLSEVDKPKSNGESCIHPRECVSYSCESMKCTEKRVCRFAAEGEVAGAGTNCGPNMVKNMSGVCELSPEARNPVYLGLLDEVAIEPTGQCQFKLDDDTKAKSLIAMKSLRAMEWFFSTISLEPNEECFDVMPVAKNEIGKTFVETRKNILTNFTDVLNQIEGDFKTLVDAKKNGTQTLTVHGDSILEGDLASRQTSGFDTLMLMYRRNLLFQSYEASMLETVSAANTKIVSLSEKLAALKDNDEMSNCEGSKYKKKGFLSGWKTKYWNKVKDHWAVQYEVTGSAAGNADIVKRENVKKILGIIGGKTPDEAQAEFTKSKYYLMDPMMFSGMKNGSYGETKKLKAKSSFLGLFGGFKDLRKAWYLKGSGSGSYTKMYNDIKPRLREYYKGLKMNKDQKGFIYEPELLTTEAKDCLDNPEKPENCAKFDPFLDDVLDEAFAHFLAWGYANDDSYENFFSNATTYRRRLLTKLEVDMQNISKYYEKVIAYRNQQNECIERVMNGLADSGVLTDDRGGLQEGSYVDLGGTRTGTSLTGVTNNALRPGSLSPITRTRFQFDLKGNTLSKLNKSSIMDNISGIGTTSSKGGVSANGLGLLSARSDAIRRANSKASSSGVKVGNKNKAVNDTIKSLAGTSRTGSSALGSSAVSGGASSGSSSGSRSGIGVGNVGKAGVSSSEDLLNGQVPTGISGNAGEIGVGSAGEGSAGQNSDNLSGVTSGYGSGYGSDGNGSGYDPNAKDRNGLTDADKERMLSEYERNKKAYDGNDEDGLFNRVSKAYVRNLDKVLTKRKKIEQ